MLQRINAWVERHLPELGLFLFGAVLRLSLHFSYDPMWGYDAPLHWEVVEFIAARGELPKADALIEAFHPPLWYALGAGLVRLGGGIFAVQWLSIFSGVLRLALTWAGLELLVTRRSARLAALALAAVLPVSVHLDGMLNAEALSCVLAAGALLLVPFAFAARDPHRWRWTAGIGVLIGLQLLTKASAAMVLFTVGLVVLAQLVLEPAPSLSARVHRALPWTLAALLPVLLCGWLWARNVREHGSPFISSFDLKTQGWAAAESARRPFFARRSLDFVLGFDTAIYERPYYRAGLEPSPHFFEVLLASTFADYWSYSFNGLAPHASAEWSMNTRPITTEGMRASVRSVLGGTVIVLAALAALAACLLSALRRRDWGQLALLASAPIAAGFCLVFAVRFPIDHFGVIKATYAVYGTPALYACFGLSVAWSLEQRRRWPLFALLMLSLTAVAQYTVACRL